MAYATAEDVQRRLSRQMSADEQALCETQLDDAAVIIDSYNAEASDAAKLVVSCRMVIRAMGDGSVDFPAGATQGTISAGGYSQSWTMSNGSTGELYLGRLEKKLLGAGNHIGSHSPLEDMVVMTP